MLQAVAEALHLSANATSDSSSSDSRSSAAPPLWVEMTEREAERLVLAGGLRIEPAPASAVTTPAVAATSAQCVQSKFCFQYIRPWEKEPSVQVLRLREEVMKQLSSQQTSTPNAAVAVSAPKRAVVPPPRAATTVHDSKRRRSLLMAMQSPLRPTRRPNAAAIRVTAAAAAEEEEEEEGENSESAAAAARPSAFASPRCKEEVLTPSRSSTSVLLAQRAAGQQQQAQPPPEQAQQQIQRTPEPVMTGKRKRVSVTISPPQMLRSRQAAPVPQLNSSRWVSPKPELPVRQQHQQLQAVEQEEEQQPPRKTRRLSEAGAKVSMTSYLIAKLRALFPCTRAAGASSDECVTSGESGTESDKSEASSARNGSSVEFSDCDLYGGNATLLADIQDALEPVLGMLETTSSRLQRVMWGRVRDLSSPFVRVPSFESQSNAQVSELAFDGFEFGDEDDSGAWTNVSSASDSGKLAVRTRRQCREMQQLSAAWRLW